MFDYWNKQIYFIQPRKRQYDCWLHIVQSELLHSITAILFTAYTSQMWMKADTFKWNHHERVMQWNWVYFCGVMSDELTPLEMWLLTARYCNHQGLDVWLIRCLNSPPHPYGKFFVFFSLRIWDCSKIRISMRSWARTSWRIKNPIKNLIKKKSRTSPRTSSRTSSKMRISMRFCSRSWFLMRFLMRFLIFDEVLDEVLDSQWGSCPRLHWDLIEILILEQPHWDFQWEILFP